jgi:hypothetical protein
VAVAAVVAVVAVVAVPGVVWAGAVSAAVSCSYKKKVPLLLSAGVYFCGKAV